MKQKPLTKEDVIELIEYIRDPHKRESIPNRYDFVHDITSFPKVMLVILGLFLLGAGLLITFDFSIGESLIALGLFTLFLVLTVEL